MKKMIKPIAAVALVAFLAYPVFIAGAATIPISATIPSMSQMNVTISKVTGPNPEDWDDTASSIAFGTLTFNPEFSIFLPQGDTLYYAVDVGVVDTSGSGWSITHDRSNLSNGTDNLNNNVNVTFVHQTSSTASDTEWKHSYQTSNGFTVSKADLTGGWLRIYYGIGTGNDDPLNGTVDNPGVLPITSDKSSGTYSGIITLTLTP